MISRRRKKTGLGTRGGIFGANDPLGGSHGEKPAVIDDDHAAGTGA